MGKNRGNNQINRSMTYRQYIETLAILENKDSWQAIIPTLVILVGGFGGDTGRTIKWLTNKFGKSQLVEFLYLDTDQTEQGAKGHLPGFDDDEFVHAAMEMLNVVLQYPERHKAIAERLGLNDPEVRTALQQVVAGDPGQASQLCILGCLSILLVSDVFRRKVSQKIGNLRSRFKQLDLPENLRVKIADRVNVIMVGSSFGGTGSGMILDAGAMVRQELDGKCNFDLALYTITADVFERELSGYPEEAGRCKVNQYRLFHELDAAETGWLNRNRIRVGGMDKTDFPCPPKIFSHIFVMQRVDSTGHDYRTKEAIADAAALHIAIDICTPVGAMFDRPERNSLLGQGLMKDAWSQARCYLATVAATSMGYDGRKLLQYNVTRQLHEFIKQFAIGRDVPPANTDEAVDIFLQQNELEERSRHNADYVNDRLRKRSMSTAPSAYARPLFSAVNGDIREYYSDAELPTILAETQQKFNSVHLDQFRERLKEARTQLAVSAEEAINQHISRLITETGIKSAKEFADALENALRESREELQTESAERASSATRFEKFASETARKLTEYWFPSWRTHKETHDLVALHYRDMVQASFESEIRSAAATVMQLAAGTTTVWVQKLATALRAAESKLGELEAERKRLRSRSESKTTALVSELDCATPEFQAEFYRANRIDNETIVQRIEQVAGKDRVGTLLTLATDSEVVNLTNRLVADNWRAKIAKLDIATVLEHLLTRQQGGEQYLKLLFTEMISNTWPMWRATPNHAGTKFGDTLVLGLPESISGGTQNRLKELIEESMSASGQSALYQAQVVKCPTSMSDRIVCVRRSHGARPDWLAGWDDSRREMEAWMKSPAHPVYTFNPSIVSRFPQVEPIENADRGELAFALALPLGMVAVRGSNYVYNARLEGANGSTRRVVPCVSHADGLAFRGQKLEPQPPVQKLIDAGKLHYEQTDAFDSSDRFAQGRERAMIEFAANGEAIEHVMEVFDLMCEAAGNTEVVDCLEVYIEDLRKSAGPKSSLFEQVNRETMLLRQLIEQLRQGR
ncbi:MAG: hypothetical protein IT422_15145 [Pirellulaceae bacterium]|nr:hypothetical protein [Pirellulaceae bacterium]